VSTRATSSNKKKPGCVIRRDAPTRRAHAHLNQGSSASEVRMVRKFAASLNAWGVDLLSPENQGKGSKETLSVVLRRCGEGREEGRSQEKKLR